MRVRVSYSINLEDVPLKISSLIAEIHQNLKNSCELVANSSSLLGIENDSMKSINDLETAENIIFDSLEQLRDIKSMLIGYQRILLSNSEPDEEEINQETYEATQNIQDLIEKLEDFQEPIDD